MHYTVDLNLTLLRFGKKTRRESHINHTLLNHYHFLLKQLPLARNLSNCSIFSITQMND